MNNSGHTLHIPVMGTGFSIDAPLRVAKYGISSVISLVDDTLIEEMRKFHSAKYGEVYEVIRRTEVDARARRITAYLNLVDRLVKRQFEEVKNSAFEMGSEITKYFELLPDSSPLKDLYKKMLKIEDPKIKQDMQDQLRESIVAGRIDVNIMTKLDRPNYDNKGNSLGPEFSDALAALRGYAQSTLKSAIVFSAGINQRLYSYAEEFKDFYADATGAIKKKIILKVSDYRSSLIQGKFFAKKGLWISEYRVESGLNCGGHAFATDGYLMGPILKEFREKKAELISTLHNIYNAALELKNKISFKIPHPVWITAQGGIGTAEEDRFLLDHYQIDGTGWGTPFLLCPEVTNVEEDTLNKLVAAKEKDLYLSDISPLGVPFHNLRLNSSDVVKEENVKAGKPGSGCPKGHLRFNSEFTEQPICSASRQFQRLKLDQLEKMSLPQQEFESTHSKIVDKACICHNLGNGVLLKNHIIKEGSQPASICPGPNMAYFSKIVTLKEMVDHIYGRISILGDTLRPHMFIKELRIYVDYLVREIQKALPELNERKIKYFNEFRNTMIEGIDYYNSLFPSILKDDGLLKNVLDELQKHRTFLEEIVIGRLKEDINLPTENPQSLEKVSV